MRANASQRRTTRRTAKVLSSIAVIAAIVAVLSPTAEAKAPCRARNTTQGTSRSTDLQAVLDAASAGDVIAIKFVCAGHFTIDKSLTLVGRPSARVPKPALLAFGDGRVLVVNAPATLKNLKIADGVYSTGFGAGIWNTSTLILKDVLVRHNMAQDGGGIWNESVLILKRSSVVENTAGFAGGILNSTSLGTTPILKLKESSSVSENAQGGIAGFRSAITLKDSSVTGNTLDSGISARLTTVTLFGSSSVSGNTASVGAGIKADRSSITLNDSSTVSGNATGGDGGGIWAYRHASVTMNGSSSITQNTADAEDKNGGSGGGIFAYCDTSLTGVVGGGNVNDNYVGTIAPVENNIVLLTC